MEFGIEGDGDLHVGNGEGFVSATGNLGAILRICGHGSCDVFALSLEVSVHVATQIS